MRARNKKLTDIVLKQAALLYSSGKSQTDVMELLDLSQPAASNAKRIAMERGWLSPPQLHLPLSERERLEQLLYADELKNLLVSAQQEGHHLRTLRIFGLNQPAQPEDVQAHQEHLVELGRHAAAHLVEEVLPYVSTIGVSWGGALLETIRALDGGQLSRLERPSPISFFPVCGAPPDVAEAALRSSSNLVALLDERVNQTMRNLNNFTGIAAAIPHGFSDREVEVLWRYFRTTVGFARVFGTDEAPGLVTQMEGVLTGVGTSNPGEDSWVTGAAEAAGIDPSILAESTFGNIAGTFLPRPGISDRAAKAVKGANHRWTGARPEHLHACARRALEAGRGGSVIITSGVKKVEILLECIRLGLASEVLIDAELAVGLSKALKGG